ncbi:hypothetical protein BD410DRAFT_808467 [Rickenella mellea]|uniref:Uncharacterized protein n=1 Tax=Rickenella mellea TaxID=50990 RepID=A0A4Y7PM94_9AGAM|nr:hypothetical protein BD410DRAFT_808467 [Rickenella mellea]
MGRNRWTTDEQEAWLKSKLPTFWEAQQTKKTAIFRDAVETAFFKQWPFVEGAATGRGSTLSGQKKRIREWFGNNGRKSGVNRAGRCKIMRLRGIPRIKPAWQVYSDLFYTTKLKATIDNAYRKHVEEAEAAHVNPDAKIAFRNRMVIEAFDEESEDVKAQVEKARARQDGISITPPADDLEGLTEEEIIRLGMNLGFEKNIEALGVTLQTLLDEAYRLTGWTGVIMIGGPRPSNLGKISSMTVFTGTPPQAPGGFPVWNENFQQDWVKVWLEFLRLAHPLDLRKRRAIMTGSDKLGTTGSCETPLTIDPDAPPPAEPHVPSVHTSPKKAKVVALKRDRPVDSDGDEIPALVEGSSEEEGEEEDDDDDDDDDDGMGDVIVDKAKEREEVDQLIDTLATKDELEVRELMEMICEGGEMDDEEEGPADTDTAASASTSAAASDAESMDATKSGTSEAESMEASGPTKSYMSVRFEAEELDLEEDDSLEITEKPAETTYAPTEIVPSPPARRASARFAKRAETMVVDELPSKPVSTRFSDLDFGISWISDARSYLLSVVINVEHHRVIQHWARLERIMDQPENRRGYQLDVDQRPNEVGEWLKKKKAMRDPPNIANPANFGVRWRVYYRSLQPVARLAGSSLRKVECSPADWGRLLKGGRRGLFLLLLSFSWWSTNTKLKKERELVYEMVEDLKWVFQQLSPVAEAQVESKKRAIEENNAAGVERKRVKT